jgi:hypothetical protein
MSKAFVLLANCNVLYDGRAYSTLQDGNYLIIRKKDGTLIIHGAELQKELNYQPPGAQLIIDGSRMISKTKKETIIIDFNEVMAQINLDDLSSHRPIIQKTEEQLCKQIENKISTLLGVNVREIHREYQTKHGPVDIFIIDEQNCKHILEVKRRKAQISACTQLERYVQAIPEAKGWLLSPSISKNALAYLQQHGFVWRQVEFE